MNNYISSYSIEKGYNKIKTRNNKRDMLRFLVKNGFDFTSVKEKENIKDNGSVFGDIEKFLEGSEMMQQIFINNDIFTIAEQFMTTLIILLFLIIFVLLSK